MKATLDLRFTTGSSLLGPMLVATSARGVCALLLGDEATATGLQARFPQARLAEDTKGLAPLLARVRAWLARPEGPLELDLDLQGTAFQQRVWQALRKVPAGATISYADLAHRLRLPSAARAVAGACARNPVALAVPCHRVVRSDGGLSGYRWGVERKRALLAREAALVQ
jgi:AraC family transcriptional regulator, regulatory protein of adaptative response / methylated-DNA-[protein]-cysteine methyltransferase